MYVNVKFMDNANEEFERDVRSGLALTPAQVSRMTADGKAVALGALSDSTYFDNLPGDEVALENMRGIDDNDVWDAAEESREKIAAYKAKKMADYRAREHNDPVNDAL